MVKNEKTTGESCAQRPCRCAKVLPIVTFVLLVPTLILSVMAYLKINSVYKAAVELQFGNETNLSKVSEVMQTPAYQKRVAEGIEQQITQIKTALSDTSANTATDTDTDTISETTGDTASDSKALDTAAAYNDKLWDENSTEALQNFGLQGTPGNAVIDVKTGKYKAIGGAYPQSAFEEVIAKLQAGETLTTDDMGQAGTLTKDVLQKILKGAHYYGEEKAGIVVVEYSDILCPFCQRHFNAKTIENIVDASNGKVALVFKNMPIAGLHPTAPLGAKGAECAGQIGGTKAYYDYLTQAFTYKVFNGSNVADIAKKVGLDEAKFAACFTK
jgi:hypothetical protein